MGIKRGALVLIGVQWRFQYGFGEYWCDGVMDMIYLMVIEKSRLEASSK